MSVVNYKDFYFSTNTWEFYNLSFVEGKSKKQTNKKQRPEIFS